MAEAPRVWFPDAVEALWLRGLADRLTPEIREELKGLGLDLEGRLQAGYDAGVIGRATQHAARRMFPEMSPEQAMYRMGEIAIDQFAFSLLGRALFPMLKVFGSRRTMLRMQSNMRSANNFAELEITEVAPERFRIVFKQHDGMPYFWKALTDRGSHHSGVSRASSENLVDDGQSLTLFYDVRNTIDSPFPGDEVERWLRAPAFKK